jgi:hypothetical protein
MGCDVHMYLKKYTDEEDLYINNLVSDLDSYGEPENETIWKYGSEELSTIRKIKDRIKRESRDSKLSNLLDSSLEKRWVVIDEPYGGRNYNLFSKLADVRSYGNSDCISEPRGVPDDLSLFYEIKTNQWEGDCHSHSYFYLSELLNHDFSNISKDFSDFVESYRGKEDIDNYRIVFFFDN